MFYHRRFLWETTMQQSGPSHLPEPWTFQSVEWWGNFLLFINLFKLVHGSLFPHTEWPKVYLGGIYYLFVWHVGLVALKWVSDEINTYRTSTFL